MSLSHCAVRRHGSVGSADTICCSVADEDDEEEEDVEVGDVTDSALSCFLFWHFSCFPTGFPDGGGGGGDDGCSSAGPRCTQENRV